MVVTALLVFEVGNFVEKLTLVVVIDDRTVGHSNISPMMVENSVWHLLRRNLILPPKFGGADAMHVSLMSDESNMDSEVRPTA